jgi:uncharacterized protein (DUF1800 family)
LAVIALNRLAFGPRPGDVHTSVAAFNALPGETDVEKLTQWVDAQLAAPMTAEEYANPVDEPELAAILTAGGLASLSKPLDQLWRDYYRDHDSGSNPVRSSPVTEVRLATLARAVHSRWQLREVLADFWHNHFNVYAWDGSYAAATWTSYDRDVIRAGMLGNFRVLLGRVAQSHAMLYYLDNTSNRNISPNENYARELFELHTLGEAHYLGVKPQHTITGFAEGAPVGYVDVDVYEAARCFTGWTILDDRDAPDDGKFTYVHRYHDDGQKIVLGMPPIERLQNGAQAHGEAVLDKVAFHAGTAHHVCQRLCRRLVSDTPSAELVAAVTAEFIRLKSDPEQLKHVVRSIVLSEEFRATWSGKIKRPVEAFFSTLRALPATVVLKPTGDSGFWSAFDNMGQRLFGRRSPDGYPDTKEAWSGAASLLYRWQLINNLLDDDFGPDDAGRATLLINLAQIDMGGAQTPNALVAFWTERLLGRPALDDPAHHAALVALLQGWETEPDVTPVYGPDTPMAPEDIAERLKWMVAVLCMAPEFQWR